MSPAEQNRLRILIRALTQSERALLCQAIETEGKLGDREACLSLAKTLGLEIVL